MSDDTQSLLNQLKDDAILGNVDDIIDQMKSGTDLTADDSKQDLPQLSEDALGQFILSHGGKLVQDSTALVSRLKKTVAASGDAEEVSSIAALITSTAAAIETLNKIHTQNKKIQAAKDLKQQEIEGKKEVARIKQDGGSSMGNGVIIANREEMMAMLLERRNKSPIVEVECDDISDISDVEDTMDIVDKDRLGHA